MKKQKQIALFMSGLLIAGCLTGCGAMEALSDHISTQAASAVDSLSAESSAAVDDAAYAREDEAEYGEQFQIYKPFGMTYDAVKDELWYNGKRVRWFEDYYQLNEEESAGTDFFDEHGVVDVYAVRDFRNLVQHTDGSYDPSGKVVGLKQFSDKEFAARDVETLKNPPMRAAYAIEGGGELKEQEKKEMAREYAPFGLTYDADHEKWYFGGKKVRFFLDILSSNGKSPNGGEFQGAIRQWWEDDGAVDIYTVRDFSKLNDDGNGKLKAIKEYSRQEFDARTQEEKDGRKSAS